MFAGLLLAVILFTSFVILARQLIHFGSFCVLRGDTNCLGQFTNTKYR